MQVKYGIIGQPNCTLTASLNASEEEQCTNSSGSFVVGTALRIIEKRLGSGLGLFPIG